MPGRTIDEIDVDGSALTTDQHPLLLFYDGDCSFCARWVARVVAADGGHRARFATLQGATFRRLTTAYPEFAQPGSVVLVSRRANGVDEVFTRSTAIRKLIAGLPNFRIFSFVLHVVPTPLSDLGYLTFSKLRDLLFSRWANCRPDFDRSSGLFLD